MELTINTHEHVPHQLLSDANRPLMDRQPLSTYPSQTAASCTSALSQWPPCIQSERERERTKAIMKQCGLMDLKALFALQILHLAFQFDLGKHTPNIKYGF